MEKLPSELLYMIFSFLDKESRKSATATCQLWFDVIRNSNLSNHICFNGIVENLQQRIENSEWDWKRWPALKTFELQGYSEKEDLLNDLPIDFKQCPTLELVIFNAAIDFADLFPDCSHWVATINKLAFNPQLDITQFGVDHIWSLEIFGQNDEVFKLINENVKGLKELKVEKFSYLNDLVCKDALLELLILDNENQPTGLKIAGLKKLKTLGVRKIAHIDNLVCKDALLELTINAYDSSGLKIAGLKKLKTLGVRKIAQLDNLVGIDALLNLCVENVFGSELKEYDLSNITKRFKNLQKCEINVYNVDGLKPEEYAQTVQDVFQDSATRVKVVIGEFTSSPTYLTKEPFQRCVVKKEDSDDSD